VLVLAAFAAGAPGAAGAAPEPRDLGPDLAPLVAKHGVPGLVAAVVEGDRTTALGAAGVRARGSEERVLAGDRFHLGSCTKAMTATLCALLVEEGRLSWDAPAAGVLEDPAKADPGWKGATLERLLTMRAGAPPDLDADGLWARLWRREGTPTEQRAVLARGVLGKPPLHAPGTRTLYANASYALAGVLAERAAGKPFEELLRDRLFRALGMESAGFGAPGSRDSVDQPRGHDGEGKPVPPGPAADNPPAVAPAGTVHASVGDWARFAALHLEAARGRPRLLKAESFRRLHAVPGGGDDYAMGWGVGRRPDLGRVLEHAGSNTMWYALVRIAPEKGFAIVVACNEAGPGLAKGEAACEGAAELLARRVLEGRKPPR